MFNAFRRASFIVLLAGPLAGCGSFAPGPLDLAAVHSDAEPALQATSDKNAATSEQLAKAKAHFAARNFGLAAEAYRGAVEARPDNAEGWLGLAAAYDELGRFDLADRAYGRALKLTGPTSQLLNNRGYSRLLRGDYAAARRDLLAARAKDPENPQIARNIRLLRR